MRALVLENIASPPVYKEIDLSLNQEGYSKIDLCAAALNRRDYWITKGLYPGVVAPVVLGSDGVGDYKGKTVIINPGTHWGNDARVQSKDYTILGVPHHGTFAEQVMVHDRQIHVKPGYLSLHEAAALPLAGLTAFRALNKAQYSKGEKVLVTGIGGGVAIMALQMALAAGLEVFVSSSSPSKIERAIEMGATAGVNYHEENWAELLKEMSGGIDIVIDGAGGSGISKLVDIANPAGRIVMYGGTAGKINGISPQKLFWKQLSILGTSMGNQGDFTDMLRFVEKYRIKPVIDRVVELKDGAKAIAEMENSDTFGKIVININC